MKGKREKKYSRKQIFGAVLALVLVLCAAGGTIAWLAASTNSVTNTFVPSVVTNQITEDITTSVKKNVAVKNTGDTTAYIRATVIVNALDANGDIVPVAPSYTCSYNLAVNGWQKGSDGYYYFTQPVAKGDSTEALISSCEPTGTNEDGYRLQVTILSEAIQSEGVDSKGNKPIELAWNVDIDEGKIINATIVN